MHCHMFSNDIKKVYKSIIPLKVRVALWMKFISLKNYYLFLVAIFSNKSKRYFNFKGKVYKYFIAIYNTTFLNERAVEIPIIMDYIREFNNRRILEIGNVMSHYFKFNYEIVDKYEKGEGVVNQDIIDFIPKSKYDLIISISTFEHIGFDEAIRYSNEKMSNIRQESLLKAIDKAKSLLNENGVFIFTAPYGFNCFLDSQLKENELELTEILYLKRIDSNNKWIQVNYDDVKDIKYGEPYICANALIIGIYKN